MPLLDQLLKPSTIATGVGALGDYLQRRSATNNAVGSLRTGGENAQRIYGPYAAAGTKALGALSMLTDPATAQTYLESTPGYQFRQEEGRKQIVRTAAAKRSLLSGGTLKALERYGQDYASNEFDKEFGRNLTIANMGLGASGEQARIEQEISNALAAGDFQRAGELSSLIGAGVDLAGEIFGGADKYTRLPIPGGEGGIAGGGAAGAIKSGVGTLGKAIGTGAKTVAGGVGKGIGALAGAIGSIPVAGQIALGVGGAILAGKYIFGVGNTHQKADQWVQGNQNKFDAGIAGINDEVNSGQLTPEQGVEARNKMIRDYVTAARQFAGKGKDQRRVIDNAFRTLRQNYPQQLQDARVAGFIDVPAEIQAQGWF